MFRVVYQTRENTIFFPLSHFLPPMTASREAEAVFGRAYINFITTNGNVKSLEFFMIAYKDYTMLLEKIENVNIYLYYDKKKKKRKGR